MSAVSTKARLAVLLVAVSVTMSAGALVALVDTRPETVKAVEWAEANLASLPNTLEALSAYPVAYRLAAFKRSSPLTKYALWQENLQQIASRPLSAEQRAVVLQLKNALRPEFYRDDLDNQKDKQAVIGPICKRIGEVFTREQTRMLAVVGPVTSTTEPRLVSWVRQLKGFLPSYVANANANADHDCQCAEDTGCLGCETWEYCGFSDGCSAHLGCGCGGIWSCTALCEPL